MEKELKQTIAEGIVRMAFLGPECTGKTTLCQKLSEFFDTTWVPEYMRLYLQQKWDEKQEVCTWNDLLPIAYGQMSLENELIKSANKYIFCDTNLLELMIYSYIYYGKCPSQIQHYAIENHYDVIFLTDIDVPWQADDLRDRPNEREFMFDAFRQSLDKYDLKYTILRGNIQKRIETVTAILQSR